jgi:hypothetical protein
MVEEQLYPEGVETVVHRVISITSPQTLPNIHTYTVCFFEKRNSFVFFFEKSRILMKQRTQRTPLIKPAHQFVCFWRDLCNLGFCPTAPGL